MSQTSPKGIDRQGLDAAFDADETLKSNLIVEGQLLSDQMQTDAAADRFAQAAEIEERLSDHCVELNLQEKGWIHLFSAASCWARAGDFHTAISLAEQLDSQEGLPLRLRERVQEFTRTLRQRRRQWGAGLPLTVGAE